MDTHLVVGAGPVGTHTALLLADSGAQVRVVTRSGTGPEHPNVERIAADAADPARLRTLAAGAVAVYNCANPAYTRWSTDWPPLAAALLDAASVSGAVLATVSNLYGYGRVTGPIRDDSPLAPCDHKGEVRVRMWLDALAAHEAGRVRVVEARASDYADAGDSSHLARNAPAVLAGRTVRVLGDADQPHSWTTTHDTARLLVAVAADERAHGRAWLVPTAPPRTQREALADIATAVYNCANPAYTRWSTDWPPLAAALLDAASGAGAVLATVSNLYGYGRVAGPIGDDSPLAPCDHKGEVRVRMWLDALAAHEAGRVRVVEVRASDYADAGDSSHLARNAPGVLAGRTVRVLGDADQPHSWTTTHDTARLLVAVAAHERAHGRAWLVPTSPPRTQREALADIATAAGMPAPRVSVLGPRAMRTLGIAVPMLRELAGTAYQFTAPFVVDDSATRDLVGWGPQPWEETVARVVEGARTTATTGAR